MKYTLIGRVDTLVVIPFEFDGAEEELEDFSHALLKATLHEKGVLAAQTVCIPINLSQLSENKTEQEKMASALSLLTLSRSDLATVFAENGEKEFSAEDVIPRVFSVFASKDVLDIMYEFFLEKLAENEK